MDVNLDFTTFWGAWEIERLTCDLVCWRRQQACRMKAFAERNASCTSLIEDKNDCVWETTLQHTFWNFCHSFSSSKNAFRLFSSLFFMKKKGKKNIQTAANHTCTWQFFFCIWQKVFNSNQRMHFYFVGFRIRAPQNQWRCVWKGQKKRKHKRNLKCIYAHDQCCETISMGWLRWCACLHNYIYIFFFTNWCPFFFWQHFEIHNNKVYCTFWYT